MNSACALAKSMASLGVLLIGILVGALPCESRAQASGLAEQNYVEAINRSNNVTPFAMDGFGEKINLKDGGVRFEWTDIDIPGNSALPVRLQRVSVIEDDSVVGDLQGFGLGGSFDVPYLSGVFPVTGWQVIGPNPNNRCSAPNAPPNATTNIDASDYWTGNSLHIPGAGNQLMLAQPSNAIPAISDGQEYPWITKEFWRFRCLPATKNGYPGEAFLAVSPNGDKYYFDWVVSTFRNGFSKMYANYGARSDTNLYVVRFLVSRIEDRHGNWVNFTYSNDMLNSVVANDGRYIRVVGMSGGDIAEISSSIGSFKYSYGSPMTVTRPDGSTWQLSSSGYLSMETSEFLPVYMSTPKCPLPDSSTGNFQLSIKSPSGATATYVFSVRRHFRHNIPKICSMFVAQNATFQSYQFLKIPNFSDSFTLISKTVSGPELPTMQWTYEYGIGSDALAFEDNCKKVADSGGVLLGCKSSMQTKIHGPDGQLKTYTFGAMYQVNENQLLEESLGTETETFKVVKYSYVPESEVSNYPFPSFVGSELISLSDHNAVAGLRPVKSTQISLDGRVFTKSTTAFDVFARPTKIIKSSTP